MQKLNRTKKSRQKPLEISRPFTWEELDQAIAALPAGVAAGLDEKSFAKMLELQGENWLLTVFDVNSYWWTA